MSTTNIEGPPPTKIMKVEATNDEILSELLDLPDELTSINTESFLRTSTNNIDQSLDVGPLSTNNTSNLTTPPINNVMNPSGNPPTNVALPGNITNQNPCLLYTSPSPRDRTRTRMPSSA